MKLLYINDELATGDGSNYHALGMLKSFEKILGGENVCSYPQAQDGSGKPVNHTVGGLRQKIKGTLQVIRFFRKKYLSIKRSKAIVNDLNSKDFIPTHVVARSTVFDITAVYVARAFGAKLIYEFNTPEFYERGVIKKEPLVGAIEKWEKKVLTESDWVYINSSVCRDMLCYHYGVDKEKFLVIPNGFMSELYFEAQDEREKIRYAIRKEEKIDNKFVVTFIGSLKVWHGIKTLCEVADAMEKYNDICFLVIGDGEKRDQINQYILDHDNMIFKGKVNLTKMKKLLYASDLGIMPYDKQEWFYYSPLKMFDMIGAGLPFIGTDVGQIGEYCRSKLNDNFLLNENTVDVVMNRILEIKNNSNKEMKKMVEKTQSNETWGNRASELIVKIQ